MYNETAYSHRISEFKILTELTGNEDIPYVLNGVQGRFKSSLIGGGSGTSTGLFGPATIYNNSASTYVITSYDIKSPITVTNAQATIVQTGDTFTLNPKSFTGSLSLVVGAQTYIIDVLPSTVNTPTIVSPTVTTNLSSNVTITTSAFLTTGATDTHASTSWQLASDSAFTTIIQQSINDTVNLNSWTISNLTANTTYYLRFQYIGTLLGQSAWSTTIILTTSTVFIPSAITGQFTSNLSSSYFGNALAVSGDGTIVVVGAPSENISTGAAYIYTLTAGSWVQTIRLSNNISSSSFGNSVDISLDGTTIIVGASGDPTSVYGAIYIYTKVAGVWTLLTSLVTTATLGSAFGDSVSLNATGSLIAVGSPYDTGTIGAAYIYSLSAGVLTLVTRLTDNASGTGYGTVKFSSDGSTLVVGAANVNTTTGGSFYIYNIVSTVWTQVAKFSGLVSLGDSLAIDATGTILVVGSPYENSYVGNAYVYKNTAGIWSLVGALPLSNNGGWQGASVAINQAGTDIAVGASTQNAPLTSTTGSVNFYTYNGTAWVLDTSTNNNAANSGFGRIIAINSLGTLVVASAPYLNSNTGTVYIVQ